MNLLHMKYAVEVARTGSINKAAEKLLIGQPNLSRAIKELEASLGIRLFERSARGMTLTREGETFMGYARSILKQVDAVEDTFRNGLSVKKRFSVSVPRASYISEAFVRFSQSLAEQPDVEAFYQETNAAQTIRNVLQEDYRLGIIRYSEEYDRYYKSMLEEKNLSYELVAEFPLVLAMGRDCPLAQRETVTETQLADYVELAHADPMVPALSMTEVRRAELPETVRRRIFVFERASQLELLARNPRTFMWVSAIPAELLDRYGLVQRQCPEGGRIYKDVMIRRQEYSFTTLDHRFIEALIATKRELFGWMEGTE